MKTTTKTMRVSWEAAVALESAELPRALARKLAEAPSDCLHEALVVKVTEAERSTLRRAISRTVR